MYIPSTTSIHFLRTLGIPFQFVDDPSDATEHGESKTGTGFDVDAVDDFSGALSPSGIVGVKSTEMNFSIIIIDRLPYF